MEHEGTCGSSSESGSPGVDYGQGCLSNASAGSVLESTELVRPRYSSPLLASYYSSAWNSLVLQYDLDRF